jgi:hypothetical protein
LSGKPRTFRELLELQSLVVLRLLPLLLLALTVPAAGASAALPDRGTSFYTHDHVTKNDNWHIEVQMSKKTRLSVETLVLYAQKCKATIAEVEVPVTRDGVLAKSGTFTPTAKGAEENSGSYTLTSTFTSSTRLEGSFQITQPGCDSGVKAFVAKRGGDDGHTNHQHSGGKGHANHGAPFPDLSKASVHQRRQGRALWAQSLRSARELFPTYRTARNRGFVRFPRKWQRPLLFHLRSNAYEDDDVLLDARRPESLVYWWPKRGRPVLVAYMFRAPSGPIPARAKNALVWHQHYNRFGKLGATQMTHVWLLDRSEGLKRAMANCLPIAALERSIPRFRYSKPGVYADSAESQPCPTDG